MPPEQSQIRLLAEQLRTGQTTSCQLVEQALDKIRQHNTTIGGADPVFIDIDYDGARSAAKASDALRSAGHIPSLLAGLPISVKDNISVRQKITRAGSRIMPPHAAESDAAIIRRMQAAGAVIVGRTNMSEFAFSGLGLNPHYGTPRNPFSQERVAGGSSSGAAVSVARMMAVAGLGTDTGGSVRIPAAFCGLTGFKPTAARVPMEGIIPLSRTLDAAGALTTGVDDSIIMDSILSGSALETRPIPIQQIRIGITQDYVMDGCEPAVTTAFENALNRLAQLGAKIIPFSFGTLKNIPALFSQGGFTAAEAWAWHRQHVGSELTGYDPRVAARIQRGQHISAADYIDMFSMRQDLMKDAARCLLGIDIWLMPTTPIVAPLLTQLEQDDSHFFDINGLVLRNPAIINILDGCALTLPCHAPGNLPVGLTLAGLDNTDAIVLQCARTIERHLRQD